MPHWSRVAAPLAVTLLATAACAYVVPMSGTRAVTAARRNVCGTPGSATDAACVVREHTRVPGGYRVVVDRRPPAGNDRVVVTLRGNGSVEVEPVDTAAAPPRR